jgi:hypothetical protein
MDKQDTKRLMETLITGEDFSRFLTNGEQHIIKYSDLENIKTIEELLPESRDYRIILVETNYNTGHWCCILRYGKTIEWFDSYGLAVDGELKFINVLKNKMLGQDFKHLTRILYEATKRGFHTIYNKRKLQKYKDGVNTCGRWVILRITMFKDMLFDLHDFLQFIEKSVAGSGLKNDELVVNWIK